VVGSLSARGVVYSNPPKNSTKWPSFDDEGLAEVSREVGRDLSIHDDFNVLLQRASTRENPAEFGIIYISGCVVSIHKRSQTGSYRRVTESVKFAQFMRLCQTLRNGLQPYFAALAEALEGLLDVDPDQWFALLAKTSGTVKDIGNCFREREVVLPDSMVRCGKMRSKTKRERLESLTT
jgi:hypothetical protein